MIYDETEPHFTGMPLKHASEVCKMIEREKHYTDLFTNFHLDICSHVFVFGERERKKDSSNAIAIGIKQ